jgi:hypothetical protein
MKVFHCSACFECYYIHPQDPATVCGCIVLFRCVLVYWCGLAGVGWYPIAGWFTECSNLHLDTTLLQPNHTNTPVHTETEQYTYIQSPAPEDECDNIRNMLSNKKTSSVPTCIRIPPYSSRTAPIHQYTPKQNNTPTYSHRLLRMNVITFETC